MDASVVGHTHRMKDDRRVKGIEEEKQEDVGLVLDKRGGKGGVEGIRGRERESPCEYVIRSSSFARNRAVE